MQARTSLHKPPVASITHRTVALRLRGLGVTDSGDARARGGSIYICGLPVILSLSWKRQGGRILIAPLRSRGLSVTTSRDAHVTAACHAGFSSSGRRKRRGGCAFALAWPSRRGQRGSARVIGHVPRCNLVVVERAGCYLLCSGQTRSCPGGKAHQKDPSRRVQKLAAVSS
jgi:hypothetical protein